MQRKLQSVLYSKFSQYLQKKERKKDNVHIVFCVHKLEEHFQNWFSSNNTDSEFLLAIKSWAWCSLIASVRAQPDSGAAL